MRDKLLLEFLVFLGYNRVKKVIEGDINRFHFRDSKHSDMVL